MLPVRNTDPLYIVRASGSPHDEAMNNLFKAAFFRAVAGRLDSNLEALNRAAVLGEIAGRTFLNSCLGGEEGSLAEVLFVGEIVYSGDQNLINGFARLRL